MTKKDFNKRHFLICHNCYWCLSYLLDLENNGIENFSKCQKCNNHIKLMYISELASKECI